MQSGCDSTAYKPKAASGFAFSFQPQIYGHALRCWGALSRLVRLIPLLYGGRPGLRLRCQLRPGFGGSPA